MIIAIVILSFALASSVLIIMSLAIKLDTTHMQVIALEWDNNALEKRLKTANRQVIDRVLELDALARKIPSGGKEAAKPVHEASILPSGITAEAERLCRDSGPCVLDEEATITLPRDLTNHRVVFGSEAYDDESA